MFSEFKGIRPLMEGLVDADYLNCVPTGSNVVERNNWKIDSGRMHSVSYVGRRGFDNDSVFQVDGNRIKNIWDHSHTVYLGSKKAGEYLLSFFVVDPDYVDPNAYYYPESEKVVWQNLFIIRNEITSEGIRNPVMWSTPLLCQSRNLATLDITSLQVCISGTSPRICFVSFKNICTYWLNIDDTTTYSPSAASLYFQDRELGGIGDPLFFKVLLEGSASTNGDYECLYRGDTLQAQYEVATSNHFKNNGCEWYDNRLVTEASNAVWLTCTDPYSYLETARNYFDTSTRTFTWRENNVNNFWTQWYHSTLSTDNVVDVKACYGYLYFINDHSVEMWTRSGTESAPLNNVSNYVNNVTIKKCDVVNGRLWAITETDGRLDMVLIGADGNPTVVSNSAISKLLKDYVSTELVHFTTILQNKESHFCITRNDGDRVKYLCYNTTAGAWYRLDYCKRVAPIVQFGQCAVSAECLDLVQNDKCYDMEDDGNAYQNAKYERNLVDVYVPLTKRMSLPAVEVYGEFGYGADVENNDKLMLQNSWTNGRTWSSEYWRTPPRLGQFQPKVVFHGLGSGENILLKFKWFNIKPYVITGINPIAK